MTNPNPENLGPYANPAMSSAGIGGTQRPEPAPANGIQASRDGGPGPFRPQPAPPSWPIDGIEADTAPMFPILRGQRGVRYIPRWGWPPVVKVEREYSTGEKVGCAAGLGLLAIALATYFCRYPIGEEINKVLGLQYAPTAPTRPECGPGIDGGGNTTASGSNDGTFSVSGNGGATMVDVTTHNDSTFTVDVVILAPGQTATLQNVYGDHVWKYDNACGVDDVASQVPAHLKNLDQLPNTHASQVSEKDLEDRGILSITTGSSTESFHPVAEGMDRQLSPDARTQFSAALYHALAPVVRESLRRG